MATTILSHTVTAYNMYIKHRILIVGLHPLVKPFSSHLATVSFYIWICGCILCIQIKQVAHFDGDFS